MSQLLHYDIQTAMKTVRDHIIYRQTGPSNSNMQTSVASSLASWQTCIVC